MGVGQKYGVTHFSLCTSKAQDLYLEQSEQYHECANPLCTVTAVKKLVS